MSISNFCIWQREQEEAKLKRLLTIGLAGSAALHIIVAFAIAWLNRSPAITEEPIDFIFVEETAPETPETQTPQEKPTEVVKPVPIEEELIPLKQELIEIEEIVTPKPILQELPVEPTEIRESLTTNPSSSTSNLSANVTSSSAKAQPQPASANAKSNNQLKESVASLNPISSNVNPTQSQSSASAFRASAVTPSQELPPINKPLQPASSQKLAQTPSQANPTAPERIVPNRLPPSSVSEPLNTPKPVSPTPETIAASPILPGTITPRQAIPKPAEDVSQPVLTASNDLNPLRTGMSESSNPLVENPSVASPSNPGVVAARPSPPTRIENTTSSVSSRSEALEQLRQDLQGNYEASANSTPTSAPNPTSSEAVTPNRSIPTIPNRFTSPVSSPSQNRQQLNSQLNGLTGNIGESSNAEANPTSPGEVSQNRSTPTVSPTNASTPLVAASSGLGQLREGLRGGQSSLYGSGNSVEANPMSPGSVTATQLSQPGQAGNSSPNAGYRGGLSCVLGCPPEYPKELKEKGLEGRPIVEFTVDQYGNVVDPRIVESSSHRELDRAAIAAVRRMKFDPPAQNRLARMPINFAVDGSRFHEEARQRMAE